MRPIAPEILEAAAERAKNELADAIEGYANGNPLILLRHIVELNEGLSVIEYVEMDQHGNTEEGEAEDVTDPDEPDEAPVPENDYAG